MKAEDVFRDVRNFQTVEATKARSRQAGLSGRLDELGSAPHCHA
jgi:hypothetical protein